MATAKAKLKPECDICFDEEGTYSCIKMTHEAYRGHKEPVTKEVLATAITQISDAVRRLDKSGLNQKAIIALINDDTKLGKGLIETVLLSLRDLAKTYTK